MKILGLDHVVIRVQDLEASLRFYCEALGCSEERRLDELGLVQLRAGDALIDLVPVDSPLGRAGGAAPDPKATSITSPCASKASTRRLWPPIFAATASNPARFPNVMVPRGAGPRCTSATRTETRSS